MENTTQLNMRHIQEPREYDDLEDTDTELEHGPQTTEKYLEESETDERDQIENPTKSNMKKIQEPRGDDYLVDTDTDMEHGPAHDTKEVEIQLTKILLLWLLKIDKIKKLMMKNRL